MVADGAIAIREPVVLTAAGKAKKISETTTLADSVSTNFAQALTNTTGDTVSSVYDPNSETFCMAFKDTSNSSYGTVVCGTPSNGTVTWGTPVVFESSAIDDQPKLAAGGNRIHVTYYDTSNNNAGIRSASISGTTPTFSSLTVFATGSTYNDTKAMHIAYDTSTNYVIVLYQGGSTAKTWVQAIYHDTSDGTYTAGSATELYTGTLTNAASGIVFDPDTNRTIIAYKDGSNSSYPTANVVQSSGTAGSPTVTIGADTLLNGSSAADDMDIVYDTTNNKAVIFFDDAGGGNLVKAVIGTVTGGGTNTIAVTSPTTIWDPSGNPNYWAAGYDGDKNRIQYFYHDEDSGDDFTYKVITPGASSLSVADGGVISANQNKMGSGSASFGAGHGVLCATLDSGNSSRISYGMVYFASTTSSNLDNGNYLGISAEAISDTATGKINVIGGTSTGHSSLTIGNHYFTNGAGAIGLVGNTTGEQYLGKAISATEIQLLENEGYLYGTADGAITKGKPVQVKSDGDFQMVSETTTSYSFAQGSSADVEQGTNTHGAIYYDDDLNKMVVINADASPGGGNDKLTIFYCSVTGGTTNSISFATGNVIGDYTNATLTNIAASFDPVSKTTLVGVNNGSAGQAFAFTRSSTTSISHGTIGVSFYGGNPDAIDIVNVGENKWVIGYLQGNNYPAVRVATASGTTLSFGTEVVVRSSATSVANTSSNAGFCMSYDTASLQVVFFFKDGTTFDLHAKVGTISGTDISFGSQTTAMNSGGDSFPHPGAAAYVPGKDVHVIAFNKSNNGEVLAVKTSGSGTDATLVNASGTAPGHAGNVVFDSQPALKSNVFVAYENTPVIVYSDDSVDINSIAVSIDGTTLTMGTDRTIETTTADDMQMGAYDPDTKRSVIIFKENSDNDMMAQVIAVEGSETTTTMTTDGENYLGIATKTVANDAQAEVATFGQIDAQQSGLTAGQKYFVQSDGSLGTSADNLVPGYSGTVTTVAGKALSATKLLISE